MKLKLCLWTMAAGALALPYAAGHAAGTELTVKAATRDDLTATADAVRKQMVPGGRYEFVSPAERSQVETTLADMDATFDRSGGSVATMNQDAKIQLYNDQETVNAILTKRDADRRICKSVAPTGSLIPKTSCHTYGEIEKSQRDSQQFMHDSMQVGQLPKTGG